MSRFIFIVVIPLLITVGFLNCARVDLEQVEGKVEYTSLSADATFCVNPPEEFGTYSNILFVIDVSGSNVQAPSPTDPMKTRRLGAMQNFFNKYKGNAYLRWGLELFGGNVPGSAQHLVVDGNSQNFGSAAQFEAALATFQNTADGNGTPYVAALNEARNALEKSELFSRTNNQPVGSVHVIFISDGVPSGDLDTNIYDVIKRMVDVSGSKLHLSTVYYNVGGTATAGAVDRLKQMATLGNGRFQDASNGENINIDDLINGGTVKEPYFIKDLFVYNLNSAQCDNGNIDADSDSDGLCDEDELRYNEQLSKQIDASPAYKGKLFSITNRNSFDGRFSDLFMYKHLIEGEALPACDLAAIDIAVDEDNDLLNRCEEMFLLSKAPQGPTDAWTQDMIKNGNFASYQNFDSDGDGILDSLEFLFFKKKGFAMNYNTINSRTNGRTLYDYFKNHQSVLKPDSTVPYNIKIAWVRKNDLGQNCYRIDQENLPVYKIKGVAANQVSGNSRLAHGENENVILVYYLMTTENDPDGKGMMRFSYQKRAYSNQQSAISYTDRKFEEVIAK